VVRASILSPRVHLDIVVELESDLFGGGFVEKLFFHHVVLEIVVEHVDDVAEDLVVNQSSNTFFVSLLDSSDDSVPVRRLLKRKWQLSCEGQIVEGLDLFQKPILTTVKSRPDPVLRVTRCTSRLGSASRMFFRIGRGRVVIILSDSCLLYKEIDLKCLRGLGKSAFIQAILR
jgi:hypothetical protein